MREMLTANREIIKEGNEFRINVLKDLMTLKCSSIKIKTDANTTEVLKLQCQQAKFDNELEVARVAMNKVRLKLKRLKSQNINTRFAVSISLNWKWWQR